MLGKSITRHLLCPQTKSLFVPVQQCRSNSPFTATTWLPSTSRSIHSTSLTYESAKKQVARLRKRDQRDKRAEKERIAEANKPHPALGYSPGNEKVWQESKLHAILLTPEQVENLPIPKMDVEMEPERVIIRDENGRAIMDDDGRFKTQETGRMVPKLVQGRPIAKHVQLPSIFNFGVDAREKRLLFEDLPFLRSSGKVYEREYNATRGGRDTELTDTDREKFAMEDAGQEMGLQYWLGRVLDLKNASSRGLLFENKKRIVAAFSEPENPHDPGRPEVKAALLTARIHRLWEYLQERKRDIHNRRRLLLIIRERAKILKYLRKTNRARYETILPQLGLERGAVEGELYLPREAFNQEELIGR
ncbi:hypothetical protein CPB86DRAFT_749929 [Serendipita vermifera]|nr:hypothetical protein CPB86DRAFT_749929 [Serendipita vermifera]